MPRKIPSVFSNDRTTITVSRITKQRLAKKAQGMESWDQFLSRLAGGE